MRCVIAAENFKRSISESFENCFAVAGRAQGRVHFEIGIVSGPGRSVFYLRTIAEDRLSILLPKFVTPRDRGIGEGKVMRASFAGNGNPSLFSRTQQLNAPGRADMLAMH